jgi:hypothetical protein
MGKFCTIDDLAVLTVNGEEIYRDRGPLWVDLDQLDPTLKLFPNATVPNVALIPILSVNAVKPYGSYHVKFSGGAGQWTDPYIAVIQSTVDPPAFKNWIYFPSSFAYNLISNGVRYRRADWAYKPIVYDSQLNSIEDPNLSGLARANTFYGPQGVVDFNAYINSVTVEFLGLIDITRLFYLDPNNALKSVKTYGRDYEIIGSYELTARSGGSDGPIVFSETFDDRPSYSVDCVTIPMCPENTCFACRHGDQVCCFDGNGRATSVNDPDQLVKVGCYE